MRNTEMMSLEGAILEATRICHRENSRWWRDPGTQEPVKRNVGELLMLVTSELAEALEADRKGLKDDKLPARPGLEVELADALIRIFDMAGGLKLDVAGALVDKLLYNSKRVDHTDAHRIADGGKKY
jgi:NTP pyrophosphatase (non-canonical NTP hydrolase)